MLVRPSSVSRFSRCSSATTSALPRTSHAPLPASMCSLNSACRASLLNSGAGTEPASPPMALSAPTSTECVSVTSVIMLLVLDASSYSAANTSASG